MSEMATEDLWKAVMAERAVLGEEAFTVLCGLEWQMRLEKWIAELVDPSASMTRKRRMVRRALMVESGTRSREACEQADREMTNRGTGWQDHWQSLKRHQLHAFAWPPRSVRGVQAGPQRPQPGSPGAPGCGILPQPERGRAVVPLLERLKSGVPVDDVAGELAALSEDARMELEEQTGRKLSFRSGDSRAPWNLPQAQRPPWARDVW